MTIENLWGMEDSVMRVYECTFSSEQLNLGSGETFKMRYHLIVVL